MKLHKQNNIAIIGLGYVGLPLAIEFAKKNRVIGFDVDAERIKQLRNGIDLTNENDLDVLNRILDNGENTQLFLTNNFSEVTNCNIYIITVPTPIDKYNNPDLSFLLNATKSVGSILKKNDIVIYESTVYPGCTEEECVPFLEAASGLKFNVDFYCGYSPERVSPGDKINTLTKIIKVTSGSTPFIADIVDSLYRSIIIAGTYKVTSIKIAEAAKSIENAQRDINISFINELSLIFDKMGIDTQDVLDAAGTKWNFLPFRPGLVGGHCISVDPYYLAHKSQKLGYRPQVILSGRYVNDYMGQFIAGKVIKLMIKKGHSILGNKVLILGFTFKENCPDYRNTKVINIYSELKQFGLEIDIVDPYVNALNIQDEYGIKVKPNIQFDKNYNAIILAVAHADFKNIDFAKYRKNDTIIFDVKSFLDRDLVDSRL